MFKPGDWVECVDANGTDYLRKGEYYRVGCVEVGRVVPVGGCVAYNPERFRLAPSTTSSTDARGVTHTYISTDPQARKNTPIATGVVDYFPLALAEIARVSKAGNDQHNPGQPLHWDRSKSQDHADCLMRHFVERGTTDTDGQRHSAKLAWRALALLQTELEKAGGK